jgi:hypothetical protein
VVLSPANLKQAQSLMIPTSAALLRKISWLKRTGLKRNISVLKRKSYPPSNGGLGISAKGVGSRHS